MLYTQAKQLNIFGENYMQASDMIPHFEILTPLLIEYDDCILLVRNGVPILDLPMPAPENILVRYDIKTRKLAVSTTLLLPEMKQELRLNRRLVNKRGVRLETGTGYRNTKGSTHCWVFDLSLPDVQFTRQELEAKRRNALKYTAKSRYTKLREKSVSLLSDVELAFLDKVENIQNDPTQALELLQQLKSAASQTRHVLNALNGARLKKEQVEAPVKPVRALIKALITGTAPQPSTFKLQGDRILIPTKDVKAACVAAGLPTTAYKNDPMWRVNYNKNINGTTCYVASFKIDA